MTINTKATIILSVFAATLLGAITLLAMVPDTYWEQIPERPEILLPPIAFYLFFIWAIPLLGCLDEGIRPYWKSVFEITGYMHVLLVIGCGFGVVASRLV